MQVATPRFACRESWRVAGGTSVSSPHVAGIFSSDSGSVNYGADPHSHLSAPYDVTLGNDGPSSGIYLCVAGPGYDSPTGTFVMTVAMVPFIPNGWAAVGFPAMAINNAFLLKDVVLLVASL